ncbi:MAG: TolC family protein [Kiritimatiellae bacterium]|nr:TolC family protein [Kiritimatiellia bacterium]
MNACIKTAGSGVVLLLVGWLAGCARFQNPDVPAIEGYLPAEQRPAPAAPGQGPGRNPPLATTGLQSLTLDDCVRLALENNPQNKMAASSVKAAQEAAGAAFAPFYPTVGVDGGAARWKQRIYLPEGIAPPGTILPDMVGPTDDWNAEIRGRWMLFDSGERRAKLRAANAALGATQADEERVRQDLALAVHHAYFRLLTETEMRAVARESLARAEDHLRLAGDRFAAGDVPEVDVLRTKVEVADARVSLVRAENQVDIGRGNLNTVMGLPVESLLRIEKATNISVSPDSINLTNAFDQSIHNRPALQAGLMRVAASRHAMNRAQSTFGPSVFADGSYGWRDNDFFPQDEEWSARLGFEWPVFTGFLRVRELARARAELNREEAALERQIQDVRQEVWIYYTRLKESHELILAAEVMVANANESLRSVRERYEAGASPVTDLLDAEADMARAQAIQVQANGDYRIACAAFQWAVGDLWQDVSRIR